MKSHTSSTTPTKRRTPPTPQRHERPDGGHAFLPDMSEGGGRTHDELANNLGENFISSATSGEEDAAGHNDERTAAEIGGPFVITTGAQEFADDEDETNPAGAEPAAFPTAIRSKS